MASSGMNVDELTIEKKQVYYKIRSIFPNTDPSYILDILINTPAGVRDNAGMHNLITDLVDHLILDGDNHIDLNTIGRSHTYWEQISSSSETQFERLIGIFPDADPDYIRDFAKKFCNNPQKINTFVEENLNQKSYPTREEYVVRKKREEKYRKYFTEFDVESFVKEFPNPFEYFEGEETTYTEEKTVLSLLCNWFQNLELHTIVSEYKNAIYNPSLTVKRLEERGGIKRIIRNEYLKDLDKNMPAFAFICNRRKIEQYLEKIQKEEEESLKKSKETNQMFQCGSCFNDFIASKCSTCDNGHIFCNDCISIGTKCKIAEGKYTIRCFENCISVFGLKTLKKILTPNMYKILMKNQQEEELAAANIGNLENCPFCGFKSVVNEEDKILMCMHEDCMKQSCRRCKKANHLPHECSDVFEAKNVRLYVEEKLTYVLVRTCYKCGKEFVKLEGCNRMTCSNCGAVMCYLCDKAVSPDNYKHFNAQGGERFDLCPLYSDDKRQEAEAVIEVAKMLKKDLLTKNPDLDLTVVDKLLPELPPKTDGAHDQIVNAHQIPERAIRIAKAISP